MRPSHWFVPISESDEIKSEPDAIEFLKIWTGETFIHTGGTAFWKNGRLDREALIYSGITHWRVRKDIQL
jgi:hypothetical protein